MNITYGSVCSGIESASVAWEPLGMVADWFSEIEPFPCAVLKHHWPNVPNLGDMTLLPELVRMGLISAPDILVGGTPCQAFSVAGSRGSLDDERGQLTLTYVDLANAIDEQREKGDECIVTWENVPGVLNTADNAFGCFLGELSGSGCELFPSTDKPATGKSSKLWRWCKKTKRHRAKWSNAGCVFGPQRTIAWRIIDAQYFGVPQRRRRVFVVASARDGFDPCKVLFEPEGMRRDTAPSRETGEEVAGTLASRTGTGSDHTITQYGDEIAGTLTARHDSSPCHDRGQNMVCTGHRMVAFGEYATDETASTMKARDYKDATDLIVTPMNTQVITRGGALGRATGFGLSKPGEAAYTLSAAHSHAIHYDTTVRRLTPIECERLQGFPDNHARIPWRNKLVEDCPDGPRYKAIGNSKAVPCIQFIGVRIMSELMGIL